MSMSTAQQSVPSNQGQTPKVDLRPYSVGHHLFASECS
uniref:Uncharacterized protein n=1 Tax=Anguilla anguilla TaxID=7936 RepID=A0A0E9RCU6_ANGAN